MRFKRTMAMLLAGALCAGMMAGCGSSSEDTTAADETSSGSAAAASTSDSTSDASGGEITLIMASRDQFLSTLEEAATAAGEEYGYKIVAQDAQNDAAKQIQYIETAVNGGDKAIIVNPVDSDAAQSLVDAAGDTPLVFVNRAPSDLHVLDPENVAFCGSDEYLAGHYQGEYLADYFNKQSKTEISYIMLEGTLGMVSTTKRTQGALDALEENGITATAALEPLVCEWDRAETLDKMGPVLSGGTQFDCVIANNDEMALGAVEACENSGKEIDFPICGIDCTDVGAEAIVAGTMAMTVYQNPVGQGEGAVLACKNLIEGNPVNEGTEFELDDSGESYSDSMIWVPFEPVTADNVADYM